MSSETLTVRVRLLADGSALIGETRLSAQELEKLRDSADSAQSGFDDLNASSDDLGGSLADMAGSAVKAVAAVASIGAAGSAWVQFDSATRNTANLTGSALKDIKALALESGIAMGRFAGDASAAFGVVGSKSPKLLEDAAALKGVADAVFMLTDADSAMGGSLSDSDTAGAITGMLNAYSVGIDEAVVKANVFSNALAAAAQVGSVNISNLNATVAGVGTTFAMANIPAEELLAVSELLGEKSDALQGSQAATSLNSVTIALQTASDKFKQYGISGVDTTLKTEGFAAALRKLSPIIGDTNALVDIFGKDHANAVTILVNNTEAIDEYTRKISGTNTAYDQAIAGSKTFSKQVTILGANLKNIASVAIDDFVGDHAAASLAVLNVGLAAVAENIEVFEAVAVVLGVRALAPMAAGFTTSAAAAVKNQVALVTQAAAARQAAAAGTARAATSARAHAQVSAAALAEAQAHRANLAQMAIYGPARAKAERDVTAAAAAHAAATSAVTLAESRAAAAMGATTAAARLQSVALRATAGAARLASGALALVGGPVGAAILAGIVAWQLYKSEVLEVKIAGIAMTEAVLVGIEYLRFGFQAAFSFIHEKGVDTYEALASGWAYVQAASDVVFGAIKNAWNSIMSGLASTFSRFAQTIADKMPTAPGTTELANQLTFLSGSLSVAAKGFENAGTANTNFTTALAARQSVVTESIAGMRQSVVTIDELKTSRDAAIAGVRTEMGALVDAAGQTAATAGTTKDLSDKVKDLETAFNAGGRGAKNFGEAAKKASEEVLKLQQALDWDEKTLGMDAAAKDALKFEDALRRTGKFSEDEIKRQGDIYEARKRSLELRKKGVDLADQEAKKSASRLADLEKEVGYLQIADEKTRERQKYLDEFTEADQQRAADLYDQKVSLEDHNDLIEKQQGLWKGVRGEIQGTLADFFSGTVSIEDGLKGLSKHFRGMIAEQQSAQLMASAGNFFNPASASSGGILSGLSGGSGSMLDMTGLGNLVSSGAETIGASLFSSFGGAGSEQAAMLAAQTADFGVDGLMSTMDSFTAGTSALSSVPWGQVATGMMSLVEGDWTGVATSAISAALMFTPAAPLAPFVDPVVRLVVGAFDNGETRQGEAFDWHKGTEDPRFVSGPSGGAFADGLVSDVVADYSTNINEMLERLGSEMELEYFHAGASTSTKGRGGTHIGGRLTGGLVVGQTWDEGQKTGGTQTLNAEQSAQQLLGDAEKLRLEVLQVASDLPEWISVILAEVDTEAMPSAEVGGILSLVEALGVMDQKTGEVSEAFDSGSAFGATLIGLIDSADGSAASMSNIVSKMFGLKSSFEGLGLSTDGLTADFIKQAGGVDLLATKTAAYYSQFYSAEEQFEKTWGDMSAKVADGFAELGIAAPKTREEFNEIVSGLDLTSESGQETYLELMNLYPAFGFIQDASEGARQKLEGLKNISVSPDQRAANDWDDLNNELIELGVGGIPLTRAGLAGYTDSLDETNIEHQKAITILDGHKSAIDGFYSAFDTAFDGLTEIAIAPAERGKSAWNDLNGELDSLGLDALPATRAGLAEYKDGLDENNEAHRDGVALLYKNKGVIDGYYKELEKTEQDRLKKLEKAEEARFKNVAKAAEDAANAQTKAMEDLREGAKGLLDYVRDLSLGDTSTLSNAARFAQAQTLYEGTLSAAQLGDLDAIKDLQGITSTYRSLANDFYGDSDRYREVELGTRQDVARVAGTRLAMDDQALADYLGVPQLAEGGVVSQPTLVLVGEAGPEVVTPLNRSDGSNGLGEVKGTLTVLLREMQENNRLLRKIAEDNNDNAVRQRRSTQLSGQQAVVAVQSAKVAVGYN